MSADILESQARREEERATPSGYRQAALLRLQAAHALSVEADAVLHTSIPDAVALLRRTEANLRQACVDVERMADAACQRAEEWLERVQRLQ